MFDCNRFEEKVPPSNPAPRRADVEPLFHCAFKSAVQRREVMREPRSVCARYLGQWHRESAQVIHNSDGALRYM